MSERVRPEDMAFLANESASTPMHNATPVSYTHLTLPTIYSV